MAGSQALGIAIDGGPDLQVIDRKHAGGIGEGESRTDPNPPKPQIRSLIGRPIGA